MSGEAPEETRYKGIRWRRARGRVGWFDEDQDKWVMWRPGKDAPPRPPGWEGPGGKSGGPISQSRPKWRSPYRIVPVVLILAAVIYAVVQVTTSSGSAAKKETAASAKLVGQCLTQDGTTDGHPKYSTSPVPCTSPKASVKVVAVVPTAPGQSQLCPSGTTAYEIPYLGVKYPHAECLQPVATHQSP